MRKLIHSSFELDLSPFKISDTEENNWFSDTFFTKYTFPFEIDLEEDLDKAFGFISQYNTTPETYYLVKYVHYDKIEEAVFEIESYQTKLSCTLRFGMEQLPSFEKKLAELSLEKFDLPSGTSIFQHAEMVIQKGFPDVNYNFPQVHIDKYDPEDSLWSGFEKIINNRREGVFLINTVDEVNDITYNRNVMQPLPYLIYILQRGMIDAGYTLSGKIISDERLQKACLYGDVDYFKKPTYQEEITIYQVSEDAIEINYNNPSNSKAQKFFYTTPLATPGKYNIFGTIKTQYRSNLRAFFTIKYRNTILFSVYSKSTNIFSGSKWKDYSVDVDFETIMDLNPNDITIEAYQAFTTKEIIMDLTISLIRINDATGVAIPSIINDNSVDLTRAVPDITFGDFVKVIKNWFNYDLTIVDRFAVMNPVESNINHNDAINLRFSEIKRPLRKFQSGISFLLQFQEVDNAEFQFLPVFQNNTQIINTNYTVDDKTITIEIPALPLPILTRAGVQTAYALESNDSKVFLVHYDGLISGNNYARPIDNYLLPAVHLKYWQKWFDFRIDSQAFNWVFYSFFDRYLNLKVKSKIYAYGRYHIIKSINRTEVKPDLFEIEIDSEALE